MRMPSCLLHPSREVPWCCVVYATSHFVAVVSVGSRGAPTPLFLDQTEARTAEKNCFGDRFLPPPPPPLSQGLDLALVVNPVQVQENAPNLSYVHACALYATVSCLSNMINLSPVKPSLGVKPKYVVSPSKTKNRVKRGGESW